MLFSKGGTDGVSTRVGAEFYYLILFYMCHEVKDLFQLALFVALSLISDAKIWRYFRPAMTFCVSRSECLRQPLPFCAICEKRPQIWRISTEKGIKICICARLIVPFEKVLPLNKAN